MSRIAEARISDYPVELAFYPPDADCPEDRYFAKDYSSDLLGIRPGDGSNLSLEEVVRATSGATSREKG